MHTQNAPRRPKPLADALADLCESVSGVLDDAGVAPRAATALARGASVARKSADLGGRVARAIVEAFDDADPVLATDAAGDDETTTKEKTS